MKKIVSALLMICGASVASVNTALQNNEEDAVKYYKVGEQIVIPIPLDRFPNGASSFQCLDANDLVKHNHHSTDFIAKPVFKPGSNEMSFSVSQCQKMGQKDNEGNYVYDSDGNLKNQPNDWHNVQQDWVEVIAEAYTPGLYEGFITIKGHADGYPYKQNSIEIETQPVNFKFYVSEMTTLSAPSGIAVQFADSSASYDKQIDINTVIRNVSNSSVTLKKNSHLDYYLKASTNNNQKPMVDIWYNPLGNDACVQVFKCEDNNYLIREYVLRDRSLSRLEMPQVGYREYAPIKGDKKEGLDNFKDYSYPNSSISYETRARNRNMHFENQIALYSEGVRIWGKSPSWVGSCVLATASDVVMNGAGFCNETPMDIPETPNGEDIIYEGEDYFFMTNLPSLVGVNVRFEPVAGALNPISWLEIGTPANYWDDYANVNNNNVNTLANQKKVYVRSKHNMIRQKLTVTPGIYKYKVVIEDPKSLAVKSSFVRTIVVKEGALHPKASGKSVAILMGDETWFKPYQLDIATGIVNFSDEYVNLNNFRYEYYGQVEDSQADLTKAKYQPRDWYSGNGNADVTFADCGNGRFRLRYRYKYNFSIAPNFSALDYKTGFVYGSTVEMNKTDDFSLGYFNEDPVRRRYNPNMPLFDKDNRLLWGSLPDWANQCEDYIAPVNSSSSVPPSSSSSSYTPPPPPPSSSSDIPRSSSSKPVLVARLSSSSSFNAFHDLAVRFKVVSTSNNDVSLAIDFINKGNAAAQVGNYTARFYYSDESIPNDATLDYNENYIPKDIISSVTKKQCDEHLFALDFKLNQSLTISPNSVVPNGGASWRFQLQPSEYTFDPANLKGSWMDVSEMTENGKMVIYNAQGTPIYGVHQPCDGFTQKQLKLVVKGQAHTEGVHTAKISYIPDAMASVEIKIENKGDSAVAGPAYVDFHVTHTPGAVPVIIFGGKTLATAGGSIADNDVLVTHISAGNNHTFRFTLLGGIPAGPNFSKTIQFKLMDQCIGGCKEMVETTSYRWNLDDDWSAKDIKGYNFIPTLRIPVYNSENEKLIGNPDKSAPVYVVKQVNGPDNGEKEVLKHSRPTISAMVPNRTDAVAYSGGQLLSGGDFESQWVQGWDVYEPDTLHVVKSVRGRTPQGSRYLSMNGGTSISQVLNSAAAQILADSGAVLTVWHKNASNTASIKLNNVEIKVLGTSSKWIVDTIPIPSSSFNQLKDDTLSIYAYGIDSLRLDDIILVPYSKAQPTTYATRFTNTSGEELETRAYDGDKEQLVTTSQRDAMGRLSKKYLPFAMDCGGVEDCNSDLKTLNNPAVAVTKYTAANPDYPDAGEMPYVETHWKPDPMATKDVESAPGAPFSLDSAHIVRVFSSGVNMSGINWLDSASLNSAVSLDSNVRNYEDKYGYRFSSYLSKNYHAKKDSDPTHLWELSVDQDGRRTFTVKDGEGHVIVSGVLDSDGMLQSRSVNELDERGNVIVAHSPLSCEYVENASKSNCVAPDSFFYDTESRVIKSIEPDAGITLTYYDYAGRVRATQTQNQIHKGKATVSGYDDLGRVIYTGEWDVVVLSDLRSFFMNPSTPDDKKRPYVEELIPGTVTRTFYDKAPSQDSLNALGVKLLPNGESLEYTRGRVAAIVSDVKRVLDANGNPVQTAAGKDSVIRVSTASSYDKYGRVVANYTYDPTMPTESLGLLSVKNTYDVGGKLTSSTKFPYGADKSRSVTERYSYDRLGRIKTIEVQKDASKFAELVSYTYYPTGSVRSVVLGGSITIDYTYHISGAVASAIVKRADGSNLYKEFLSYEDCGDNGCKPQYNGNISRMTHELVTQSRIPQTRDSRYYYDFMNRLTKVDDADMMFDEAIAYDDQGRITSLRRSAHAENTTGGEYTYENRKNRLLSVAQGIGGGDFKFLGDASKDVDRDMSDPANFDYDSEGNLIEDKSKRMKISYDWRGMPVEFKLQNTENSSDSTRLTMMYDGSGRRVAKTRARKAAGATEWETELVTHYTGIGTEVRDQFHNNILDKVKVVVNMPNGLGRYGVEDDMDSYVALGENDDPNAMFEWYLKNNLGSTMLVYGTQSVSQPDMADFGIEKAAYDYRAFGEQMSIVEPADKVTENFTGKELDDEIALNYFGARYLDPMLGLWTSVDPKRQFNGPYLYAGNGANPVNAVDNTGNYMVRKRGGSYEIRPMSYGEAFIGWLARDAAVAAASVVGAYAVATGSAAAFAVGGATAVYGAAKGFITGGSNRLGGTAIGIGEAGAQHVTERIVIEGSAAVGKTMTVGLNAFDALLGGVDLFSKADDNAFIEDFNNSFANCNNGGDCNSFPTQRAAEEYAEGLGGGKVDIGDIIVENE